MRTTVMEPPPANSPAPTPHAPEGLRAIKSAVPGRRVLHAINPFVCAILRSPFHRVLSGQVLLLTFTGRRSGRPFTIPVGYLRDGDVLTVFSGQRWPRNLRGGATVTLELQGRRATAHADVVEEPAAVLAEAERMIAARGARAASTTDWGSTRGLCVLCAAASHRRRCTASSSPVVSAAMSGCACA